MWWGACESIKKQNLIKKILSASVIYALAPQLPKLVSLFMMPIFTKHMTAEDYGITGIIMAYMAAFEAFKDLGLRVILTNSFFKYPNRYRFIWRRIHGVIQLWSIIYGLLLALLLRLIIPSQAADNYLYIAALILLPIIFFEPLISIGREYYQLNKKPIPISIISVFSGLIAIIFSYIFIVVYQQGYLGVLTGLFASGVFNFFAYLFLVYWKQKLYPSFSFNLAWLMPKLKITFPTIPHYYAGYIINVSDRVLLDLFKIPIKDIGMYSFAYSIGVYFSIIGKSFNQASGPFYMDFYKKDNIQGDTAARNMSYLFQFGLLLFAFLISVWSKEIFEILAKNDDLKSTYIISIIIFFSYTYFPSYAFNGMKIWYKEKTQVLLKISVVAALISIGLNILLIPMVGYLGAAISTFVSMLYMGYGGFIFKEINQLFYVDYNWKILGGITVVLLCLSLIMVSQTIMFKFLVTIILVIILIFGLNYLRNNSKAFFKSF